MLKLSGIKGSDSQSDSTTLNESASPRKRQSKQKLVENQIRKAIRAEIESIVQEAKEGSDSSWMFSGQKKPNNSRTGNVTLGLLGLGFKSTGE